MANKKPTALGQRVCVPEIVQTGTVTVISKTHCEVQIDGVRQRKTFGMGGVWLLTWKETDPTGGHFLYKAKSWKSYIGNRFFRIQKHHIYKGRIGKRIITLELKNGRVTREC